MKKLTIELEGSWVLQHREDEELPISILKAELEKVESIQVAESSLTSLTIVYDEKSADSSSITSLVVRLFNERYPEAEANSVVTFMTSDYAEELGDGQNSGEQKAETNEASEQQQRIELPKAEPAKQESDEEIIAKLHKDIDALVGGYEFKALAKEIGGIAAKIKETNTYEVFTSQCYLFSIGDGCGLTTYLECLAKLIARHRLCKMSSRPVCEVRLGAYHEGHEPFDEARRVIEGGSSTGVRVVCVDISEWMDKTDNRHFRDFLRVVEKNSNSNIVVFRVPFVEKDVLARIRYSLSDLLSVRAISFPPLSQEELKAYAEAELKRYDFTITKSAWKYFFDRIAEEKSDGKFYGVNTVKKVVRELIYQKHVANVAKKGSSKQITGADARALCAYASDNLSGTEMLARLVGVDDIKKRVEEIISQIVVAANSGSSDRPCIHMRFVGNPGTGKTTVARIIGKILKEKGVLRIGAFFEYAGRDFCGRYVGETAPKTASICRDAYGSVLFIDEAYTLFRGDDDTTDYGREAIDTLIAEMENHRNDFVVIMAGYTDDMETLMEGNLGLKSRMPYTIEFPNFSREQLYDIFVSMSQERFKCDKAMFEAAHEFFTNLPDEVINAKEFSNARFVRNLYERTWAKAAMRCQLNGKSEVVLTRDDFEQASADKEFAVHNDPKKTRLGF